MNLSPKAKKWRDEIWKTGLLILGILAFRSSVASMYVVPTGSMIPTILPGDHFVASKFAYGVHFPFFDTAFADVRDPARGDIVVFPSPVEPGIDLVKRVVAVGGDTIEVVENKIILNGKPLDLQPLGKNPEGLEVFMETVGNHHHEIQMDPNDPNLQLRNMKPLTIPPGYFFPMGDNRDHSADGRYFGPVKVADLRAKALRIFYSWDLSRFPFFRFSRTGGALP